MSVLVQTLWADHSRCDLEFEDWNEIFENQTDGPTMTDWNQSLHSRPAEPEAGAGFALPSSEDEEEEEEEEDEDEDVDEGITAATRSPPIPYRLVWMDDGNDGLTAGPDPPGSAPSETAGAVSEPEEAVGSGGPDGLSALDTLEVLEVEQEVRDDARWLYEVPQQGWDQKGEEDPSGSALSWSRQVLDQPSPDMEAARRVLNNILDRKCRAVNISSTYSRTSPTPQQGLRGELSSRSAALGDISNMDAVRRLPSPSPPAWLSARPAPRPSGPAANHRCPQLRKLQHRVTEFKLLKLLQSKEAAVAHGDGGPAPLLRTSLRSLQAARKNRSLETDHAHRSYTHSDHAHRSYTYSGHAHPDPHHHDDRLAPPLRARPQSDASPVRRGSIYRSASPSRAAASKRLHGFTKTPPPSSGIPHLLAPPPSSGIPHLLAPPPSSGIPHLSAALCGRGRVFAAPERPSAVAWGGDRRSAPR
ncbi:unnamed protein product [Merluccius merluccius]